MTDTRTKYNIHFTDSICPYLNPYQESHKAKNQQEKKKNNSKAIRLKKVKSREEREKIKIKMLGKPPSTPPLLRLFVVHLICCSRILHVLQYVHCFSFTANMGRVLGPGFEGQFDDFKVSGPVVKYVGPQVGQQTKAPDIDILQTPKWMMYYYGRSKAFNQTEDLINLPSGFVGAAQSMDGKVFNKIDGPIMNGAIFGPSYSKKESEKEKEAFDSLHVGIGDIVQDPLSGLWHMFYFGGDNVKGPTPYGMAKGIHMKIGRAESKDGVTWSRPKRKIGDNSLFEDSNIVLDRGEEGSFDDLFVAWPQICPLPDGSIGMFYHTFNTKTFQFEVGLAASKEGLKGPYIKQGKCNLPRGEKGSYRDLGHATRCCIPNPDPATSDKYKLLMFAECANMAATNSIGLYGSNNGIDWEDMHDGPIFSGAGIDSGRWDAQTLGCPYVVRRDSNLYMYYVGFGKSASEGAAIGSIGLAISEGFDPTKWKRTS